MKSFLFIVSLVGSMSIAFGQIIDDNKVNFTYNQLPYIKVDDAFTKYDVKFVHGYEQANQEVLAAHETNRKVALDIYLQAMNQYKRMTDSIDVNYFRLMAQWEKDVNAEKTQENGQALPQPLKPPYPAPPLFPAGLEEPRLNSPMDESTVLNQINIEGFEKGLGGFVVTVNMLGLSNIQISETKTGSGTTTKYTYTARYNLPVEVTVETPTQGKLIFLRILEGLQSYTIGSYDSKYDYQVYMLTKEDEFHRNLENAARLKAITETNRYLNNQIGFRQVSRTAEIYAVKKYRSYDYSDLTMAYAKTVKALMLVSQDRDRSAAMAKIQEAITDWDMIMEESNTYDKKARVNSKITAMIQCNLAELYAWKGEYEKAEMYTNLAISAGGKFKRHANDEKSFYADQKKRWNVHY